MKRLAPLVALSACIGAANLDPGARAGRLPVSPSRSGACSPDSGELARNYVDFYRRTVAIVDEPLWENYRDDLRLSSSLDSTLVVAETSDSICAAAHAAYATHFEASYDASSMNRVIVIKLDTLRAIVLDAREAVPDTVMLTGASPNLITNATFTTVIDTIWY